MALLDRSPRVATVRAVTPVTALVLDPAAFASLMHEPAVARHVAALMARRLRTLEQASSTDAR